MSSVVWSFNIFRFSIVTMSEVLRFEKKLSLLSICTSLQNQ